MSNNQTPIRVRYVLKEVCKWSSLMNPPFRYVDVVIEGGDFDNSTRQQCLQLPEPDAKALVAAMNSIVPDLAKEKSCKS